MEFAPVTKKIVAFGSKQVFLPKFAIALIRSPRLSPYQAKFQVPLNFSKFDLRDYLWHAYNVKVHAIRSSVQQQPVRSTTSKQQRHFSRPEAKKFMTVEMEKPFVWPEAPEDWEPWGEREEIDLSGKTERGERRSEVAYYRVQALQALGKPGAVLRGKGEGGKEESEALREEEERMTEVELVERRLAEKEAEKEAEMKKGKEGEEELGEKELEVLEAEKKKERKKGLKQKWDEKRSPKILEVE